MDYCTITLRDGQVALIDSDDYELVASRKWVLSRKGYAIHNTSIDGKSRCVWMHRLINNTPSGFATDHINGDKLDNRRCNLRTASAALNALNRKQATPRTKSGIVGVSWHSGQRKWNARIGINGRVVNLGSFETAEGAAAVRQEALAAYLRETAR